MVFQKLWSHHYSKTTGVISVEPDTIGYGASKAEQGSSTTQKNGTLSSQAPDMWGVKRIGGPISLSEVRDRVERSLFSILESHLIPMHSILTLI